MASVVDLKSKEEKDAELDRKIEALRKKNEALVRRHQLIQEDRMRAEQEGIAVTTPRKAKHQETEPDKARKEKENFSITVNVSNSAEPEKRIINDGRSPKTAQPSPGFETSPKSPTRRSSGRTGPFPGVRSPHMDWPGERSPHMDWPGEHFEVEGDGVNPAERAARGRRSQGRGGSRRGPRGSEDASPGERGDRWTSALSPRGGAAPGERGGRVPGRGGGVLGRGDGPGGGGDGVIGPDKKNKEWEEKRRQNIEKMNEEMEQIAEYERSQRDGMREKNPMRNFLDDPRRSGPVVEIDRKEGSRRHTRNWGGTDFEKVKTGLDREEAHVRRPRPKNQVDMTMSMTGRERAEYVRWKKEREQIDQERLERHRNATGQWRREWDAEKTESMFKDDGAPVEQELGSRRDMGKRGAPKPHTMGEFLPESVATESSRKRDRNRGRGRDKPYSMHDSRWEEQEEVNEVKEVTKSEEKETCVEKTKEEKVEEPQKELKVEEVTETADDEAEDEWEDASEEEGEEEEAVSETDSSGAEEDLVEEKLPSTSPVTPQPAAKEQRQPLHTETPKLTMPLPAENPDEKATESYPTTPFSPDGYQPVSDWGEEMELQSPRVSSSDDSPPQAANMKTSAVDKRTSRADSTPAEPASGAPTVDGFQKPIESLAQNLAEVLETASENLTDGLESGSLESTDTKRKSDQQEEIQSTQSWTEEEAIGKTSTFSSAGQLEQPTAADGKEEGNFPGAEESEAATGAVLITDFETQRTEVPLAS
ncbi:hypothetical protein FKM82_016114 [Ascaphus truei]